MTFITKLFTKYIPIAVIVIVAIAGFTYLYAANWTGPQGTPPTQNVAAPINVGGGLQSKDGTFAANDVAVLNIDNT